MGRRKRDWNYKPNYIGKLTMEDVFSQHQIKRVVFSANLYNTTPNALDAEIEVFVKTHEGRKYFFHFKANTPASVKRFRRRMLLAPMFDTTIEYEQTYIKLLKLHQLA